MCCQRNWTEMECRVQLHMLVQSQSPYRPSYLNCRVRFESNFRSVHTVLEDYISPMTELICDRKHSNYLIHRIYWQLYNESTEYGGCCAKYIGCVSAVTYIRHNLTYIFKYRRLCVLATEVGMESKFEEPAAY